jgi:hypothetical protein
MFICFILEVEKPLFYSVINNLKTVIMHAIMELLPLLFGFSIAQLFRLTKTFRFKNILFIILTVILGITANRLNGEGAELLIIDIPMTAGSTLVFIFVSRFLARI